MAPIAARLFAEGLLPAAVTTVLFRESQSSAASITRNVRTLLRNVVRTGRHSRQDSGLLVTLLRAEHQEGLQPAGTRRSSTSGFSDYHLNGTDRTVIRDFDHRSRGSTSSV